MSYIYLILIIGFLGLFWISRKESKKKIWEKASTYLINMGIPIIGKTSVDTDLRLKSHSQSIKVLKKEYNIRKLSYCILILFLGIILAFLITISEKNNSIIQDNGTIKRNTYGQGTFQVQLQANSEKNNHNCEIELSIEELSYSDAEINDMYDKAVIMLETTMVGNNLSLYEIRENMNLVTSLDQFPFRIKWESSNYNVVDSDGVVHYVEGEQVVNLRAIIQYKEFLREEQFYVEVLPKLLSEEEKWKNKLQTYLDEELAQTTEDDIVLPTEIGGEKIIWCEKSRNSGLEIVILSVIAAIAVMYGRDMELHKETKQREEEMLLDYADVVSRLTIYLTAGMTVRSAWEKISETYYDNSKRNSREERQRYIYEEFLFTMREMESGISESCAYEQFGIRCAIPRYTKFSTLLVQNLRKGSMGLAKVLKTETIEAYEDRKQRARKAGEEAGTKLLLPMMILLGMVMIMIMLPAFGTFSIS